MSNLRSESRNLSDTFARFNDEASACPDGDSEWEDIDSDEEPLRSSLRPTRGELAWREYFSERGRMPMSISDGAAVNDPGKHDTGSKEPLATSPKSSYIKYEMVRKGGPNGPPVFDELGYQLDYYKVTGSAYGSKASKLGKSRYKSEKEMMEEERRKRKIMGTPKNNVSALTLLAWDERVSRDLGIPFHTVVMEHFEEWQGRGFVAEPGEFEASKMSKERSDFVTKLAVGSAFRK